MFTKLMVKKSELVEMKTAGYWINIKMRRQSLTGYSSTRPGGLSSESFWGVCQNGLEIHDNHPDASNLAGESSKSAVEIASFQ